MTLTQDDGRAQRRDGSNRCRRLKASLLPILVMLLALSLIGGLAASGGKAESGKAGGTGNAVDPGERPPAVAGSFYPDDADQLRAAVDLYLGDAVPPHDDPPMALVAPHAGYIFSGQICADAWCQARHTPYDLVVILGTNHTLAGFRGVSIYQGSGYRTPLGLARIDQQVAAQLLAADPGFVFEPRVHAREHSVEVQVPFAQIVLPGVPIVTAVVGAPDPRLCERLGRALARVLAGRRALIVASSDLSHYPAYEDAVAADSTTLTAISTLDPDLFQAAIRRQMQSGRPALETCACGEGPIMAAMVAARELGAGHGEIISCANSGDTVLGDVRRVVGYGAVAMRPGTAAASSEALHRPAAAPASQPIDPADRKVLLALARETIRRYLVSGTAPLARGLSPVLNRHQGAFVTLSKHGELRGCIGHMAEDTPLGSVVGAMAWQAAFNDRRFSPLALSELDQIDIEISVLTPAARVAGPDALVIGRDGVVLRKDGRSAVFLPQVAVEQGWSRDQMLDQLCRKAGLPPGSWRQGAELSTFQAVVFGEADHGPSGS